MTTQGEPLRRKRRIINMDCDICRIHLVKKEATSKAPYHYTISGLKNIFLVGIDILQCPKCGIQSPIIPQMEGLHRLITRILVKKPGLLTGDEIRFLRKNAGFPQTEFAALIGVTPSHLSRIERGKTRSLGTASDKLTRAISLTSLTDNNRVHDLLLNLARKRIGAKKGYRQRQLFTLQSNGWRAEGDEKAA